MRKLLFLALLLSGSLTCAQTSDIRTTGTISASSSDCSTANSCVVVAVNNYAIASVTINGTFTGVTLNFEFSDDGGVNWYTDTCTRSDASTQENSEAVTDSTRRAWDCGVSAGTNFRVRASAWSSGTVNVGITRSAVQIEPAPTVTVSGQDAKGILVHGVTGGFTCTVTVSTATTIQAVGNSCVAPGAGLSLYITDIEFGSSAASGTAADSFPTLKSGTGGTCGAATAVIWQALTAANTTQEVHLSTPLKVTANNEVCWIMSTAGSKTIQIQGFVAP